jgi:tetratricopeptide (TPR) repeat protein
MGQCSIIHNAVWQLPSGRQGCCIRAALRGEGEAGATLPGRQIVRYSLAVWSDGGITVQGGYGPDRKRRFARGTPLGLALAAFVTSPAWLLAGQTSHSTYVETVLSIQHLIETNDLAAAHSAIDDAERKFPANGGIENLLGIVRIQQGDTKGARLAFSAAVHDDPKLVSALLNLARIDMQSAQTDRTTRDEASKLDERVLELDPRNDEATYQLATILAWEQSYRRSLDRLLHLSSHSRAGVAAQDLLCTDYAALGENEAATQAVAALAQNHDLTEQDADSCLPALRTAHRADLIVELFSAVNGMHPLSAAGQRILGLALEAEGKPAQARTVLEGAFAAGDQPVDVLVDLTRIAKNAGDYTGALGYLAHARTLDPQNASLAYEFGVICLRMNLYAESRKAIADALKLSPDNPDYNFAMGTLASFSDDPSQAQPYLLKYHSLRPQDPQGLLAVGMAAFRAKDYEGATKWLRQALLHRGTAADAYYYLGRIEREEWHLDEATADLKQSLALRPGQASVLAALGQICIETHHYPQAQSYLDQALHLDADNYDANFGLLQLYARTQDSRRDAQSKRFDEIKSKEFDQDRQMMRSLEIRPSG